jgi:hypothetical protein
MQLALVLVVVVISELLVLSRQELDSLRMAAQTN